MDALTPAESSPFLGVLLHAVGGLAAASFYIPFKKVVGLSWETFWIIGGFFSWIAAPWALALIIVPQTIEVLAQADLSSIFWTFLFGMLWGFGGLTFGLTLRYLGIGLGYCLVLGISAVLGTLVPPLFSGELFNIAKTTSGQVLLLGVFICLSGITLSGKSGIRKEKELSENKEIVDNSEFGFIKGALIALFSGVMSSFMAYAFVAGKPIADLTVEFGGPSLWQNLPVLIVVLAGGFVTNLIWCAILSYRNNTWKEFFGVSKSEDGSVLTLTSSTIFVNVIFCAIAGTTWYLQFFFYGAGTTLMGEYEFSSWSLHMASIIIFSTFWGLALREWKGVSRETQTWNIAGLSVLILSMIVIGWGNTLSTNALVN